MNIAEANAALLNGKRIPVPSHEGNTITLHAGPKPSGAITVYHAWPTGYQLLDFPSSLHALQWAGYKAEGPRLIRDIAREIFKIWPNCYFGARPYLMAMMSLERIDDHYGCDDAKSIITYFLSNAQTWRGADARRIKAELKAIAGIK